MDRYRHSVIIDDKIGIFDILDFRDEPLADDELGNCEAFIFLVYRQAGAFDLPL